MKNIKIKCPAKINLTLEIENKREDGFHNLKSIMQTISLYDYLDIKVFSQDNFEIKLEGTSKEIPYDEKNLVYKACKLFFEVNKIKGFAVEVYITKNIPIAAGLAGGSTDAAGAIYGLNELFGRPLNKKELHELCSKLGSDLNVCLEGGCLLALGRGEKVTKLNTVKTQLTLIKPKNLGISAKEAYTKYSQKQHKQKYHNTEKMLECIKNNEINEKYLYNDLEYAIFDDYTELQIIKKALPSSIMSGSGSTYFILKNHINEIFDKNYQIIENLKFVNNGVEKIEEIF